MSLHNRSHVRKPKKALLKVTSSSSVLTLSPLQGVNVKNFIKVWLSAECCNEQEACQACETPAQTGPTLDRCFQIVLPRLSVRSNHRWFRELFTLSQCTAETRRRSCFLRKFWLSVSKHSSFVFLPELSCMPVLAWVAA